MVSTISTIALLAAAAVYGIVKAVRHWAAEFHMSPPVAGPEHSPKRKPGYVYVLWDKNRPDMVKIVGSSKKLVTPLDKLYTILTPNYEEELAALYHELRGVRVAGYWYDKDATHMYFDSKIDAA